MSDFLLNTISGSKTEPGKYVATLGGFVSNVDLFDPLEFGISQKEAQYLDPSLRLTLEAAHQVREFMTGDYSEVDVHVRPQALVDSGIDYRGSNTGVYLGQLLTSTAELRDDRYEVDNHNGIGKCIAIRANRISFTFDLKGPSFVLDTGMYASFVHLPKDSHAQFSLFSFWLCHASGRFSSSPRGD